MRSFCISFSVVLATAKVYTVCSLTVNDGQPKRKLCVDDIDGFLERENESESDFCLSEGEFELDSSSSGAYESSDEELSVSLDNSLQNISSHTPEHHFQWAKWDDITKQMKICVGNLYFLVL